MRLISSIAAVLLLGVAAVAQSGAGIKPRAQADSYPATSDQSTATFGVAQLSEKQVRKTFVSSLGKQYVVLEVGVFPKSEVQLSPQDFVLAVRGEKQEIAAADPNAIAEKLAKKEEVNHDVTITPVTGVTYTAGHGDPNDPNYNNGPYEQHPHGWSTTAGVAVETGGPAREPHTVDADRRTMATELREKQLPSGSTTKAVAGYLYFPAVPGASYELRYRTGAGEVVIPLHPPSN